MKSFFKQVSIYGILPVAGKFIGFFLVPIYARIFSSYEFGIIELIISLASFIMFACNLEFYTAIGRFFHDREYLNQKRILVSTGLILTLFTTVITLIAILLAKKNIISFYLDGGDYSKEFYATVVWLFFSSMYTYLGIIPRYDNKPKLYVLITVSSLLIRVCSTILFVLFFKTGIIGVIYGHIVGSITSFIMNWIASRKYLGFHFSLHDAKDIIKFSLPIVPGLLIIGFWNPLSRNLVSKYFTVQIVGLLSFALRVTSVLEIINSAIRLAWNPILFENYKSLHFKDSFFKISKNVGLLVYLCAIFLTLTAKEIATYVGTIDYINSSILIGFLSFRGILELLNKVRGFGPLLCNQTYILTIVEIVGMIIGILMFVFIKDTLGLVGLGLIFLFPSIIKYVILAIITKNKLNVKFHGTMELFLGISLVLSLIISYFDISMLVRYVFLLITTSIGINGLWGSIKANKHFVVF